MKTFLVKSESGVVVSFEIRNSFLGSGSIARFVKRVSGCQLLSKRKMFSASEVHATFTYNGTVFLVWEPFGDNSRLLIGSEQEVDEKTIISLAREVDATRGYFV